MLLRPFPLCNRFTCLFIMKTASHLLSHQGSGHFCKVYRSVLSLHFKNKTEALERKLLVRGQASRARELRHPVFPRIPPTLSQPATPR